MALGSTNREVNITAGEVLFLETMLAVSSALLAIWPPTNKNNEALVFEPAFLLNTKKHKQSSESHSIDVPQAQQNSLQSALHRAAKCIRYYFRADQSATTQASKHERPSQVLLRRAMCHVRVFKFSRVLFSSFFGASLIRQQLLIVLFFSINKYR